MRPMLSVNRFMMAAAAAGVLSVGVPRGPGVATCVGPTMAGGKVGVPTSAVSRVGVGLPVESDEVASPRAENSAPTADQARLPSSNIPTMPTMMAISRAGEPSSGRAGRST